MKIRLKDARSFEELLIRKGFSKKAFAEAAGIGIVTALQICNGARNPSPRIAKKIAETLQVNWDDIFVIERPPQFRAAPEVAAH